MYKKTFFKLREQWKLLSYEWKHQKKLHFHFNLKQQKTVRLNLAYLNLLQKCVFVIWNTNYNHKKISLYENTSKLSYLWIFSSVKNRERKQSNAKTNKWYYFLTSLKARRAFRCRYLLRIYPFQYILFSLVGTSLLQGIKLTP